MARKTVAGSLWAAYEKWRAMAMEEGGQGAVQSRNVDFKLHNVMLTIEKASAFASPSTRRLFSAFPAVGRPLSVNNLCYVDFACFDLIENG